MRLGTNLRGHGSSSSLVFLALRYCAGSKRRRWHYKRGRISSEARISAFLHRYIIPFINSRLHKPSTHLKTQSGAARAPAARLEGRRANRGGHPHYRIEGCSTSWNYYFFAVLVCCANRHAPTSTCRTGFCVIWVRCVACGPWRHMRLGYVSWATPG